MDISYLFAGIGAIILLGFLGSLLFERTKVPDILILIFIGLILGPIMAYFGYVVIPKSTLDAIAPIFSALALVIILFDGGLNLNLEKTMQKLGIAILHTGIAFIGTMVVTAIIAFYFLNMDIVIGLLFGAILGGVSSAVVIPIMAGASANEDTKILLTLESVLTDVLCIVTALIFIEVLKGSNMDTGVLIQQLLADFVIAAFIAFLFGVMWLLILKKLEGKPFSFMITIAALLLLYAVAEFIQVSGAIAALVFGLVLSNKDEIARILKVRGSFVFDEHIRQFHSEVSFLIRTFFFVYLGITFVFSIGEGSFSNLAPFIPASIADVPIYVFILLMAVIFVGMLVVRYIAATVTVNIQKESKPDKSYIYSMLPRGLAAAVLAQLPFNIPEFTESITAAGIPLPLANQTHYYQLIAGYQNLFLNMAFMMIVLTVIATTIGFSAIEHKRASPDESNEPNKPEPSDDWEKKSLTYRKAKNASKTTDWEKAAPPAKSASKHHVKQSSQSSVSAQKHSAHSTIKTRHTARTEHTSRHTTHTEHIPKHSGTAKVHNHPSKKEHPLVKRAAEAKKAPVREPAKRSVRKTKNQK